MSAQISLGAGVCGWQVRLHAIVRHDWVDGAWVERLSHCNWQAGVSDPVVLPTSQAEEYVAQIRGGLGRAVTLHGGPLHGIVVPPHHDDDWAAQVHAHTDACRCGDGVTHYSPWNGEVAS